MPYEIDLEQPPAGYSLGAARDQEMVSVQFQEFTSTEDGQHFIQRLEGFPNEILQKLPIPIRPSQVDNMLAVVRRDGKVTVYVNEVAQKLRIRTARAIERGAAVFMNDIVDVDRIEFDVSIPDDVGILYLFSIGWRKGLFYDFGPASGPNPQPRNYDLSAILGQSYCHVLFQNRFSISDTEWDAFTTSQWFPFAGLRHETIDELIAYIRSNWSPDELLNDIASQVRERVSDMLAAWRSHSSFVPHIAILDRAVDRYQADDFVSCTGLLFPRIEGILRDHHASLGVPKKPSPDNLTASAVASKSDNEKCLLLPMRFAKYLREVYFADFDPTAADIGVSRHSVGHGVASATSFNRKSATIGILVVHQLYYLLEHQRATNAEDVASRNETFNEHEEESRAAIPGRDVSRTS